MSHSNAVWIFSPLERARELCIIALRKRKYKTTTLTHSTPGIVYISAAHERKITTQDTHSPKSNVRCANPLAPAYPKGQSCGSAPLKTQSFRRFHSIQELRTISEFNHLFYGQTTKKLTLIHQSLNT